MSVTFNISEIISDIKLGVATIEIQKKKKQTENIGLHSECPIIE